ncbi:MAG: PIN domain-containing protein [Methanosarcinales archaeon]|nr:PIN domain-containing protein [Methanosarcinales archaeon]
MSIFLDTGIIFGTYNADDKLHEDALAIYVSAFRGLWGRIYASDYIIDETCTLLKAKMKPLLALQFLRAIIASKSVSIIIINEELFDKSCDLFERYPNKAGVSFTDATTLAIMSMLKIEYLASFDGRSFDGIVSKRIGEGFFSSLSNTEKKRLMPFFKTK